MDLGILIKYIFSKEQERAERIRHEIYTANILGTIYASWLDNNSRKKFKNYYELFYCEKEKAKRDKTEKIKKISVLDMAKIMASQK